jgi:hypothetical protein
MKCRGRWNVGDALQGVPIHPSGRPKERLARRSPTISARRTVKGARTFEPSADLLAQFFRVAPKTFCLLAEAFQLSQPQIVGCNHGPSLKRVRGAVTEKRKLDGTIRVKSSRALAVHYLRREFSRLGQIDEVDRQGIGFGEVLKVEQFAANAKNIHALEE